MLLAPTDGSGVVSPGATLHFGDRVQLVTRLQVAFGAAPAAGSPRSFYGGQPLSGFVQLAVSD